MLTSILHRTFAIWPALLLLVSSASAAEPRINVLFLGDQGHHRPADRFRQIVPVLARRGIDVVYTENLHDLNAQNLASYDALLLYANIDRIEPTEEKALLDYVAAGHGFVPLHCASYCFRNSKPIVELMGAQFLRHGTGVFRDTIARPDHPLMRDFGGFESWDETYVHHLHNERDRTVLAYRVDDEGREPWTWVRTHGKGRVFYTAWGHDERTWGAPGFQNLLVRGIRWAVGRDPAAAGPYPPLAAIVPETTPKRDDVLPFEYVEAKVPYYPAGKQWGTQAEPFTTMQKPLPPDESIKHLVTPVGFEVRLFAAEPDIVKPITMNWDERGRLWIAETYDYPNELQPPGKGRDRIKICEDTDGDGRADRFTVFADKLSIPTSLAFARGGVIVHQAPDTLFLKDTDGDDVADERTVLFSGWGTGDTHAGPSNLRHGLDNWIWGMVGYSGFNGEVGGERHRFGQGFYRFKPDGSKLEFLRSTDNNTWGFGLSEEGIIFGSTANRNPSVYLPIANRYYEAVRGWSAGRLGGIADTYLFHAITDKVRQVDQHGGYTAAAGHALYTARSYPKSYWNRTAFVTDGTGHLVGTFALMADGGDFHSKNAYNLLASDDEWTAPIMAEVGPDGHVWVIDWYNYIVQHNPTPAGFETGKGGAYVTDLRDKRHGRIYRVVYKSAPPHEPLSLADPASPPLVEMLRHENMFWRLHAQRLLVERGDRDVVPLLIELVQNPDVDELGLNTAAIHALWTLHGLGALEETGSAAVAAAFGALKHPSPGVRRNAVAVLPPSSESVAAILGASLLTDDDAQVRLAALLALAEMPANDEAGKAIAAMLSQPQNMFDAWLPDATTAAAAAHHHGFLTTVLSLPAGGWGRALAMPRRTPAEPSRESRGDRPLSRPQGEGRGEGTFSAVPRNLSTISTVAEHYARIGQADSLDALVSSLAGADPQIAETIIAGLAKGWPKSQPVALSDRSEESLQKLLPRLSSGGQGQLVKLAAAWGSQGLAEYADKIAESLLETIGDEQQADEPRLAAARQLVDFRGSQPEIVDELSEVIVSPRTSPELAAGLIDALAASEAAEVGPALIEKFAVLTPAAKSAAVRVLLGRPALTRAFLDGIAQHKLQLADLTLDQKQALANHPNRRIAARAKELLAGDSGLPSPDRQKVLEELLPLTKQTGDAAFGKEVFKKQCAKCHTHSGEGAKVGPDLTGMAVHPKAELLTHILDPSRNVEGNYRVYTVVTDDGRVLNGLLAAETKTSIELIDAEAKRHAVLRENIDELAASTKSLMPEGFEKQVPPEDIVNLLEFLTQRGKYLPLDLHKAATIVSTRGMFYSEEAGAERLIFSDWSPKTFEGVPFTLIDPRGDRVPNAIMLYGPTGKFPPTMPKSVELTCNAPAKAIHFLSGVSGWGAQGELQDGSVSMIVRLHYAGGQTEDHPLRNGEYFADYIGRFDVPKSKLAFMLRSQQLRYFAIEPERSEPIARIELVKGPDRTAPVVMAVTVEGR
ncbi:MAG TPA: PVC-type heme-binding CxxCH protein [Pirellulales bacterium]|nr:PVC-type heme-binding CxxCH protein [Pirellulales bacterium]